MNDNDVIDDIFKNAVRCFAVKRGEFYADKNFGSKIKMEQSSAEILAYARQSVAGLDGVFVKSIAKNKLDVSFVVMVNGKIRTVTVEFD